jgi:hypothetical protein
LGLDSAPESPPSPAQAQPDDADEPPVDVPADAPPGRTIACTFYHRPDFELSSEPDLSEVPEGEEEILLIPPNEDRALALGQMTLSGYYSSDTFEGSSFNLRATAGETQVLGALYQFSRTLPMNQFAGGHGFTGLLYLTHPSDGGNYQAFCESRSD